MGINCRVCLVLLCLLFSTAGSALAQEPSIAPSPLFTQPTHFTPQSPAFTQQGGFTGYSQMLDFLEQLAHQHPKLLSVEKVGSTQAGKDIVLVKVQAAKPSSTTPLRFFFSARLHGDEPAGTEALLHFLHYLLEDPQGKDYLSQAEFYILPMLNVDGAEKHTRRANNKIDINRDLSRLDTPEAQALHRAFDKANPQVSIDFHEYRPCRKDYQILSKDSLAAPWDVMYLYSVHPNAPQQAKALIEKKFLPAAQAMMSQEGLSYHPYFSTQQANKQLVLVYGATSIRSTSTSFALKNSLSFLVETRGIGLNQTHLKRRVWSAFLLAKLFTEQCILHKSEVLEALQLPSSRSESICIKLRANQEQGLAFPFLNLRTQQLEMHRANTKDSRTASVLLERTLPQAYYLLPTETRAIEKLQALGIEVHYLQESTLLKLETYTLTRAKLATTLSAGIYPLLVQTKIQLQTVHLPKGTAVVSMQQKNYRLACQLLEPESSGSLVSNQFIEAQAGQVLPVYRK